MSGTHNDVFENNNQPLPREAEYLPRSSIVYENLDKKFESFHKDLENHDDVSQWEPIVYQQRFENSDNDYSFEESFNEEANQLHCSSNANEYDFQDTPSRSPIPSFSRPSSIIDQGSNISSPSMASVAELSSPSSTSLLVCLKSETRSLPTTPTSSISTSSDVLRCTAAGSSPVLSSEESAIRKKRKANPFRSEEFRPSKR